MTEFLSKHMEWIFGAAVILVFLFQAGRMLKKAKKIDREGIETDAVVSRNEEYWDPDTAGTSYTAYVTYKNEKGERTESPMTLTGDMQYAIGDKVRIRYIPGDEELVRPVK